MDGIQNGHGQSSFLSVLIIFAIVSKELLLKMIVSHDDVIKSKHFPRNWPFVRGMHRSPVNSPHKGQ